MPPITDSTQQLHQAFKYPVVQQLKDDCGLLPPVCFTSSSTVVLSQLPSSTLATQTTMRMKVMALWRCRCGGRGLIFPKEELLLCAPGRQILSQLKVCVHARLLSLTALCSEGLEKHKLQKTIDLSLHPVTLCFLELNSLRRDANIGYCWVVGLGNVNIVLSLEERNHSFPIGPLPCWHWIYAVLVQ